jgi:uncharacterized protein (DUF983 family)
MPRSCRDFATDADTIRLAGRFIAAHLVQMAGSLPNRLSEPTRTQMLWRGMRRCCPRCGGGNLFSGWFAIQPECPHCGLHFEREPGYWTGAMAVNITVVSVVFAVAFVVALALTIPDVPVGLLLGIFVPLIVALPIVYYPFSKTVWVAVDRAFLQRLDPHEHHDERYAPRDRARRP